MACCQKNTNNMPACCQQGGNDKLYERLFLLEFMVHEVCYSCACTMDCKFLQSLGPTCVCFAADSFPVITVCEDEFGACAPYDNFKVRFPSGKSCIFALKKGMESCVSNKARIIVSRKLSGNCISVFKFGTAYLKLSPDFLSVLNSPCSCSKCLRVSLDIINDECKTVGSIAVFLRLSCFGSSIITQFSECPSSDSRFFSFRGDRFNLATFGSESRANAGTTTQMCNSCQSVPDSCYQQMKAEMIFDLINFMRSDTALSILLRDSSFSKGDKLLCNYPMIYNQQASMLGDGNTYDGYGYNYAEKLGTYNSCSAQYVYNPEQLRTYAEGNLGYINGSQQMQIGNAYNQGALYAGPPINPLRNQYSTNTCLPVNAPSVTTNQNYKYNTLNEHFEIKTPLTTFENKSSMSKQVSENILSRAKSR